MGSTTLPPGAETTVGLTLMMHPGMEGPHLFRVTVPVLKSGGGGSLQLYVRGDFH